MIEVEVKIHKELRSIDNKKIATAFIKNEDGSYYKGTYNKSFNANEHECIIKGETLIHGHKMYANSIR